MSATSTDAAFPVLFDLLTVGRLDPVSLTAATGANTSFTSAAVSADIKTTQVGGDLKTKPDGTGVVGVSLPTRRAPSGSTLDLEFLSDQDEQKWLLFGGRLAKTTVGSAQVTSGYEPPALGQASPPCYVLGYTEAWLGQGLAADAGVGNLFCYIWPYVVFADPGIKLSADLGSVVANGICTPNGLYVPPTYWQGPAAPLQSFYARGRVKRANLPAVTVGLNAS